MPATKPATAKRTPKQRAANGNAALDGLQVSLDEAQKAISVLRRDLSTGGRSLVKDMETAVKSARRDLARTRKAIRSDLGDLGSALTPRRKPPGRTARVAKATSRRKPSAKAQ